MRRAGLAKAEPGQGAAQRRLDLHGSDQRQQQIAQALSDLAMAELKGRAKRPKGQEARKTTGTQRARGKRNAS